MDAIRRLGRVGMVGMLLSMAALGCSDPSECRRIATSWALGDGDPSHEARFDGLQYFTDNASGGNSSVRSYFSREDFITERELGVIRAIASSSSSPGPVAETTFTYNADGSPAGYNKEVRDIQVTTIDAVWSAWDERGRPIMGTLETTLIDRLGERELGRCSGQIIAFVYDDVEATITESVSGGVVADDGRCSDRTFVRAAADGDPALGVYTTSPGGAFRVHDTQLVCP